MRGYSLDWQWYAQRGPWAEPFFAILGYSVFMRAKHAFADVV